MTMLALTGITGCIFRSSSFLWSVRTGNHNSWILILPKQIINAQANEHQLSFLTNSKNKTGPKRAE